MLFQNQCEILLIVDMGGGSSVSRSEKKVHQQDQYVVVRRTQPRIRINKRPTHCNFNKFDKYIGEESLKLTCGSEDEYRQLMNGNHGEFMLKMRTNEISVDEAREYMEKNPECIYTNRHSPFDQEAFNKAMELELLLLQMRLACKAKSSFKAEISP